MLLAVTVGELVCVAVRVVVVEGVFEEVIELDPVQVPDPLLVIVGEPV